MRIIFTLLTFLMINSMSFGQLVISQYVETNSGSVPKGIEVFNNTGASIDFAATPLTVFQGTNGGALTIVSAATISTGTLADQAVVVIGTSDIGTYLTNNGLGSVTFKLAAFSFNGDDALEIRLNGVRQDTFGTPGVDPGASWSGGGVSTANQNIQILCSAITAGAPATGWTDPSTRFEFVADGTPGTGLGAAGLAGFGIAPDCAPPACSATVSFDSATCDAVTSGTDTYTSTFSFDIGTETGSFTVSSDVGTPSVSTISASGSITVTGVNEGAIATLSVTDGAACSLMAASVSPDCTPIPPSVEFTAASSTGAEGGTAVDICVAITNPSTTFATTVDIVFDDVFSVATSPDDFTVSPAFSAGAFGPTATLTWPISDGTDKCLTVTIVDDASVEGDETADFFLDNPSAGASLGATSFLSLTISDNDGPQPCPTAPVWEVVTTDDSPSANDGNNGEWTSVGLTGYTANGFCGGACTDLVDTWLIYGPLDATAASALSLTLDATESFGVTDLDIQYSTDYGSSPCPTSATWTSAGTITSSGTGLSFDMSAVAGASGVFIGIQYNDDGVNGYSDWTLDNFVLVSDACPSVGSPVTSSCVVCTTTLASGGAVCDATTAGVDSYTATFTFDATTEVNDLTVTITGGTSATTTVTAGTSGTITVVGTEGTDVTVQLDNALCALSVTENSPLCVPVPVAECAIGESSLVFDSFEGATVANAVTPAAYDISNDVWGLRSSMGSITGPNAGTQFWAMQDLNNTNGGGNVQHELTYDMSFTAGTYSSLNVSFYYYTDGFNGTDHLGYKYTSGGDPQVVVGQGQLESLLQNSDAWTLVSLSIPVDPAATSAQFILYGFQDGGSQYGGFDDLNICGSSAVACTATVVQSTVSCDANTVGTDTYTATFNFNASMETEDLTITVVPAPTSQSATTITAGTSGSFTVTMPETTASYTVTVSNTACEIEETVNGVTCDPLPQLAISEIMYNTSGTDDEWIEVCNIGSVSETLDGYEVLVGSTVRFTFPGGSPALAVGECITIAIGDNNTAPYNPSCPFTADYGSPTTTNNLPNSSATISLVDGAEVIDAVTYTSGSGGNGNDASLHVIDINANNSSTASNWQEVTGGGSPGVNSLTSLCAGNDDCEDAVQIIPSVFGVAVWETFPLGGSSSSVGCSGDADDDIWFRFTAASPNDVIIAQDPTAGYDVVIELFDACGGTSLMCSNVYGAGAIERAMAGSLTPGQEYYFRVYDAATGASASTDVQVMVKTFEDCQLRANSCGATNMTLSQTIYAENDGAAQLYANPAVGVVGYGFRFQEQGGGLDVTIQNPATDGYYIQLVNAGLEYGKTYDVSVQHLVLMQANGTVGSYWSGFGTVCTVTLGAAPTTNLKPQYCSGATDYYLSDELQAVYTYGASQYRFTFTPASGPALVKTSSNYAVSLYTVGAPGNGLQYGQSYDVTVEALVSGTWTAPGTVCTIFMQSQPEDASIRTQFCNGTYLFPQSNAILSTMVLGASQYEFRFTPQPAGTSLTEIKNGIGFAFHQTSLPFVSGTTYSVEVRAFAGGVWGDYATACDITLNAIPEINNGPADSEIADNKNLDTAAHQFILYPNPNDGTQFMVTRSDASFTEGVLGIEILDITGKLIHTEMRAVKGDARILVDPTAELTTGLYLLRVTDEAGSKVIRFTVN